MKSFHEHDVPNVAVVLLDGPLDGQRFKVPRVPPELVVPASLTVPLKQPASTSPHAKYRREDEQPVGGYYVFFFEECLGPDGDRVLYAPPTATEPAAGEVPSVTSAAV